MVHEKPLIDLLTLSHFDADHINGVTALLGRFQVDTLLLPYVPLWRRLLIAFQEGWSGDPDGMAYVIDPVRFLRGRGQINRIVVVVPGGEGPSGPGVVEGIPDGPWELDIRTKPPRPDDAMFIEFGSSRLEFEWAVAGGIINIMGLWEFCPYNAPRDDVTPDFATRVSDLRDRLLNVVENQREQALVDLKVAYDDEFGSSGPARNVISLFLYGGPVYGSWSATKLIDARGYVIPEGATRIPCYHRTQASAPGVSEKCSILYTGDGYLSDEQSFDDLEAYLGNARMTKLGLVQVNHHGSRDNWHAGLAAKLNPEFSIFSSDPTSGHRHPHREVWEDCVNHGRIQVDKTNHYTTGGWMLSR